MRATTGQTWLNHELLLLPSGRVVKPKTRVVHCSTCLRESLIKKLPWRNIYGFVCADGECPGARRFDRLVGPVPYANQQGWLVALRSVLRDETSIVLPLPKQR